MTEREMFDAVLDLPVDESSAYLDRACAGDAELRQRVQVLLDKSATAGSFLEQPPFDGANTADGGAGREAAGDRIGPYKLLEEIGQGGMGTVWMAEQTEPIRRGVALKLVKDGL